MIPLGRYSAAGLPSKQAISVSSTATTPPSPYWSGTVSAGISASSRAGTTGPCLARNRVHVSRRSGGTSVAEGGAVEAIPQLSRLGLVESGGFAVTGPLHLGGSVVLLRGGGPAGAG
jgi:hypothetical protein